MSVATQPDLNQQTFSPIAPVTETPAYFLKDTRMFAFADGSTRTFPYRHRGGVWTTVIFGCFAIGFIIFGWFGLIDYENLQNTGTHTDAVITTHNISSYHDKHGTHYNYSISFRYQATDSAGQTQDYYGLQTVTSYTYSNYGIGSKIGIIYDSHNPQNLIIPGDSSRITTLAMFSVLALIFLIIAVLAGIHLARASLYDQKLQSAATVLAGNIVGIDGRWYSGKSAHYTVTVKYEFTDPKTEQRHTHRVSFIRNDLHNRPLPLVGTPVAVAYLDERRYEML